MIKDKFNYDIAIHQLNEWTQFYDEGRPQVSDKEWDDLYFEVVDFEKRTGIVFDSSPTQIIHYKIVNKLQKVEHNHPMLSLAKTKDIYELQSKFNKGNWIAMSKMDGLTCSLWYKNGRLYRAETRGNGTIGEDVTHNAYVIPSIPKTIPIIDKDVVIDGEVICPSYEFDKFSKDYKNPRNFAAGSIRLLDNKECEKRRLTFVAWDVIQGIELNSLTAKLDQIKEFGFQTVIYTISDRGEDLDEDVINGLRIFNDAAGYPIDGIVVKWDDCDKYNNEGTTSHHPSGALAYKFYDDEYETELINIEWSMGRTGQISPVAIFNPVEIDGTEISRASLSNLSIMEQTLGARPFVGQKIFVSKRNQIIPKIERAQDENGEWIND